MLVPEITPKSSIHDLTLSLFYSFQETERKMVEDILLNRDKDLREQLRISKDVLQKMLKEEGSFASLVEEKVERFIKSRVEFEEKMKQEVESLREKCGLLEKMVPLGSVEERVVEDEKDAVEKMRECENQELRSDHDTMKKRLCKLLVENFQLREEMRRSVMQKEEVRKEMEGELENVRIKYEKELERERDSAAVVKREVEKLMQSRVEFEEKMKEKCHVLEQEGELKRRILEEEVESLRIQLEMLENQNDVLQKVFKKELEKMRDCHNEELERIHDLMEKRLSVGVFEKLELEKELELSRMLNEEPRKELEGELKKARETYEKELERERDSSENKLILANLEKMNLEEELSRSRVYLEERIQVLEEENSELNKTLELHTESFGNIRDLADQIKGISDSVMSGHVMANGVLSYGSNAASHAEGRLIEYPISSGEPLSGTPLQARIKFFQGKHTGIQLDGIVNNYPEQFFN